MLGARGRATAGHDDSRHLEAIMHRAQHIVGQALAGGATFTVNTMPERTLNALAEHGEINHILPAHSGDCEQVLTRFTEAGIDVDALAALLQYEGARSFVKSWKELMGCIASKSEALK
jgi:transaldolase